MFFSTCSQNLIDAIKETSLENNIEKEEVKIEKEIDRVIAKMDVIPDSTSYLFAQPTLKEERDDVFDDEDFNVIESRGSRYFIIDNIYKSTRRNKHIATLINTYGEIIYNMTEKDTIAGGEIIKIGDNYIVFKKDGEKFTYYLNDEENQNEWNKAQSK